MTAASDEEVIAKMSITKAFLVFYVGILVLLQVVSFLLPVAPTLTMVLLAGCLVYFMYMFFFMTALGRAKVVHKCFDMGQRNVKETAFLIAVSSLIWPLYPVLALPIVSLTVIQMMRGKCGRGD